MIERYLPPREVAAIFSVELKTLRNWRYLGVGPKSTKFEGSVRYAESAVKDYIARQEAA